MSTSVWNVVQLQSDCNGQSVISCHNGVSVAASVYIQSIHEVPSKSRLRLYFDVFRKSDL